MDTNTQSTFFFGKKKWILCSYATKWDALLSVYSIVPL